MTKCEICKKRIEQADRRVSLSGWAEIKGYVCGECAQELNNRFDFEMLPGKRMYNMTWAERRSVQLDYIMQMIEFGGVL